MDILKYLLLVVEVICSVALIGLILIQKSKSEGLGLAFGSGMGETLFGSRAGNILTKLTVIFAVVFLVNTLALSQIYSGRRGRSLMGRAGGAQVPVAAQPAQIPQGAAQPVPPPAAGAPTLPGADFYTEEAPAVPAAVPVEE